MQTIHRSARTKERSLFRTVKLTYPDICARFHLDPWSSESPGKLNMLATAGLVKKIPGTKAAINKVQAAGLPEEAAASWACAEAAQEVVQEKAASSTFRVDRSIF